MPDTPSNFKVRRCQGWVIGHKKDGMVSGVEQCKRPADNGVHCEKHFSQIAEQWMEK